MDWDLHGFSCWGRRFTTVTFNPTLLFLIERMTMTMVTNMNLTIRLSQPLAHAPTPTLTLTPPPTFTPNIYLVCNQSLKLTLTLSLTMKPDRKFHLNPKKNSALIHPILTCILNQNCRKIRWVRRVRFKPTNEQRLWEAFNEQRHLWSRPGTHLSEVDTVCVGCIIHVCTLWVVMTGQKHGH